MDVLKRGANSNALIPIETELLQNCRGIFINGLIDKKTSDDFLKTMLFLNKENSNKPIDVFINSPGGDVFQGLLIYDVIQGSISPVRLFCTGEAYSMAAIIFASGKHGRFILPHSKVMIHEATIPNGAGGNSSEIRQMADNLLQTRAILNKLLSENTNHTIQEIEKAISYDHYFTAEEAIQFGLCDEIISSVMEV